MFISLSAMVYDFDGSVRIPMQPGSQIRDNTRRVSRTATLDGGCSVVDQGFSHSDREFRVVGRELSRSKIETLWNLFVEHGQVYVMTWEGGFEGVIQRVQDREELDLLVYITKKID